MAREKASGQRSNDTGALAAWPIDSGQDSTLVVNALDMAIRNRRPEPGGIVHADHGTQFTSWTRPASSSRSIQWKDRALPPVE
jgi:transposase InsO family protein